jgi:hypothetical protein
MLKAASFHQQGVWLGGAGGGGFSSTKHLSWLVEEE